MNALLVVVIIFQLHLRTRYAYQNIMKNKTAVNQIEIQKCDFVFRFYFSFIDNNAVHIQCYV